MTLIPILAKTTIADAIAIMVFATLLFLLGTGVVWLLKFLFRLISRKPQALEPQSICVSFEAADEWDEDGNVLGMQRFGGYLASKLQGMHLGEFDGGVFNEKRVGLYFFGPDAQRMWNEIEADVWAYAPERPLEVVFDFGRNRGGRQVVDIADDECRHPQPLPDYENTVPDIGISPAWFFAWRIGRLLWMIGLTGLFLCWVVRLITGISEKEMMRSGIGSFVVFTLAGMFIVGGVLSLAFVSKSQRAAKRSNPGPIGRALQGDVLPGWISNKVILAIVAAVITGILIMLRMD